VKYTDPDGRKTNYTLSKKGIEFLKILEGFVKNDDGLLICYEDSKGYATKGYGLLICYGPLTEDVIAENPPQTEIEAENELKSRLPEYESQVNNRASYIFPNDVMTLDELSLTQTQADALICLTFNFGVRGGEVMRAIRDGKSQDEIKAIWLKGYKEGTAEWKRHMAEWKLFSEGIYDENPYK
jgi:GH24 family phage-related lysozyme (muramidase)